VQPFDSIKQDGFGFIGDSLLPVQDYAKSHSAAEKDKFILMG
jgi:hypothetical protein